MLAGQLRSIGGNAVSNHGYPHLCGGTFFTLTLQALKQRMGAREHYMSESDGMSDPEVLMGLIKVINPDFEPLDKKRIKGTTNDFKSCRSTKSTYFPFGESQDLDSFDKRVKTDYASALQAMEEFIDKFIDTGDAVKKHVNLVKALIDLIIQDDLIKPPIDDFFITSDGRATKKTAFGSLEKVYLPSFLLGVWHYAVAVQKDNTVGDETFDKWCPSTGGGPRTYTGHMGEGISILVDVHKPEIEATSTDNDDPTVENVAYAETMSYQRPVQQTVNNPFVFNFTQNGNNNTQIGHVEHYHAGKKEE